MSPINTSVHGTAFCEAIDGRLGVTTGISASDRAITILTAIDSTTRPQALARHSPADCATPILPAIDRTPRPQHLARPGRVLPLRARNGGVLVRAGQTEA